MTSDDRYQLGNSPSYGTPSEQTPTAIQAVSLPLAQDHGHDLMTSGTPNGDSDEAKCQSQTSSLERLLQEQNGRACVISIRGKPCVLEDTGKSPEDFVFPSFQEYKTYNCNRKYYYQEEKGGKLVQKSEQVIPRWLEWHERRDYPDGLVFDPSGNHRPTQKNLWSGLAIPPNPAIHPSKWLYLIEQCICGGRTEVSDYLLNYYAHAVQKPAELPGIAVVLRGNKGVGKGTTVRPLAQIFGPHFYQTQNKENVLGRFNRITQNKIIVYMNESTWGGNRHSEPILKGLITEPRKDIEEKNVPAYQVNNYTRLIIDSNEQWAVPVSTDERRYFFVNIPDHHHKQDQRFFEEVLHELDHGGAEGLLDLLLNRDISQFRPMMLPLTNAYEGADMAEFSLTSVQQFILDWLHDGCMVDGERLARVKRPHLFRLYAEYCAQRTIRDLPTVKAFHREVRGSVNPREIRSDGADYYVIDDINALRSAFEVNVLRRKEDWRN